MVGRTHAWWGAPMHGGARPCMVGRAHACVRIAVSPPLPLSLPPFLPLLSSLGPVGHSLVCCTSLICLHFPHMIALPTHACTAFLVCLQEMQEQDRTMQKQRDLLSGKRGAGGRGGEDEGGRGREMNLAASAMASSSPFSFSPSTPSSSSPSPSGASKSGASSSSRGGGDSPGVKKNKAPAPGTKEAAMVAMIAEKLAARKARSSNLSSPASLKGTSPGGSTWGAGIGRAATAARKSKANPSSPSTTSSSP